MPTDNEDLIAPAVNYWAQFLTNGDVGVDREMSGMGAALMILSRVQSQTIASAPDVQKFKDTLTGMIRERLSAGAHGINMATDYSPGGFLAEALQKAGIRGSANFPLKDSVYIDVENGTVTQDQVRGRSQTLYSRNPETTQATSATEPPASIFINKDPGGKGR